MVHTVRNILVGLVVIMGVAVLFKTSDRKDETTVAKKPRASEQLAAIQPATPRASAARFSNQLIVRPGRGGHYIVVADVDGVDVKFLVDTGASSVILSEQDAERIGLHASNLTFSQVYQTANGQTRAAPVTLGSISIGQLEIDDVEASVNESPMGISLLGMTFLTKLDGFQVEDGNLILFW